MKICALLTSMILVFAPGMKSARAQNGVPVKTIVALSPSGMVRSATKVATGEVGQNVILTGVGTARLEPHTEIQVPAASDRDQSLRLLKGRLFFNVNAEDLKKRAGGEFRLKTPAALLAVKGTEFFVDSTEGLDTIGVHRGSVSVESSTTHAAVALNVGEALNVRPKGIESRRPFNVSERAFADRYPSPDADPTVIQGQILSQAGVPLVSVPIELMEEKFENGMSRNVTIGTTKSRNSGRFSFPRPATGNVFSLRVRDHPGLMPTLKRLYINHGPTPDVIVTLYRPQMVTIRFIYQPDGTRSFNTASVKKGILTFKGNDVYADFAKESAGPTSASLTTISLSYDEGILHFTAGGMIYDVGAVGLDRIDTSDYTETQNSHPACIENHVYVARTADSKYVKFEVSSVKPSNAKPSTK